MGLKTETIEPPVLVVASRVGVINLFLGIAGVAACTIISGEFARGFSLGFLIGILNQYLCLQMARRGIRIAPERVMSYVLTRYFLRFFLTVTVFAVLVSKALANPMALIIGFGVSLFVSITTIVFVARGASYNP
jgi:hypothetical protein